MTFFEKLTEATASDRAEFESIPFIVEAIKGNLSLNSYVAFLNQAYHHVKQTTPLLMSAGANLPERLEKMRYPIAEYIEEEIGHDEWILSDIKACGFDSEAVRKSQPIFATELMVSYLFDAVNRKNPLGLFGMVFVLEGTSSKVATTVANELQKKLGLPDGAFTYLTSHGELDQEHFEFFKKLMNGLDNEDDKDVVIHYSKAVYKLYGDIFRSLPLELS